MQPPSSSAPAGRSRTGVPAGPTDSAVSPTAEAAADAGALREAAQRRSLVREAEIGAERVVGAVRMATAVLLGGVYFLAVARTGPETGGALDAVIARQHGLAIATMAAYFLLGAASVAIARPHLFRPWIPWASSSLDLAFVLGGLWISLANTGLGANYVLAMPSAWLIPIVLAFGAQRFNAPLQAAVTVVMAAGLVAVPALAGEWRMMPDTGAATDVFFALPPNVIRIAMIAAAGLVIALAVVRTHRLLDRMADEVRMRTALTRYLPAELAPLLAAGGEAGLHFSRRQEVAILFADIRGFTARAERLAPEALSEFVTAWRGRVQAAADAHGGIVDKHIGDAAMLLFGVTLPADADRAAAARAALDCGCAILRTVEDWNGELRAAGAAPVAIGIGVHLGEVYCGTVGGTDRLEFTVLGDAVNVAARLEALTKALRMPMLASAATVERAGGPDAGWQDLGERPIAGRSAALRLYGLPPEQAG